MYGTADLSQYNALIELVGTVGIVLLWTAANWLCCSLFQGKGDMKEIFCVSCYALMPVILFNIVYLLLSNFLIPTANSGFDIISMICYGLTVIHLLLGITIVHDFSFFKSMAMAVLILLGMFVIAFVIFVMLSLSQNLLNFVVFFSVAQLFGQSILHFYSSGDSGIIGLAWQYLRITCCGYIFNSIISAFTFMYRAIHKTKVPMYIGFGINIINATLNFLLIFGHLGLPRMGVAGAATASAMAAVVNALVIYGLGFAKRTMLRAPLSAMLDISRGFVRDYVRIGAPAMFNETIWALSILSSSARTAPAISPWLAWQCPTCPGACRRWLWAWIRWMLS